MSLNFFVLYVGGGQEKLVCDFLNEECSDWLVFCPMMEKFHRCRGVDEVVCCPLFPNYIFVSTAMDVVEFHRVLFCLRSSLFGFVRELEYEDMDVPVLYDFEVEFLNRILDDDFCMRISRGVICDGVLRVVSGPLLGFESLVSYVNRHKRFAIVSSVFRGKEVRVKFGLEVVDKC